MFQNILKGWNFLRIIRLVLALYLVFQGVKTHNWFMLGFGILFSISPLFGLGCCGTTGCDNSIKSSTSKKIEVEEVEYEEIK